MTHTPEKKQATQTACESNQMSDLTDFKEAIINMLKEQKQTMIKEVKEGMINTLHQIETINKEIEMIKKKQTEILELKSIKLKWKQH